MAEQQRRRSFDEVLNDALVQWTKKFERALEQQRQVIGREAEERTADIEGATLEHLGVLEQTVAARSAELEQVARERRDAFEEAMRGRDKELDAVGSSQGEAIEKVANDALRELEEKTTSEVRRIEEETTAARDDVRRFVAEGSTAFDEFAQKRLDELEDTLRAKLEGFRRELIDETHRVRDASDEQLNETRVLVTSETRRIEEQAAAAQDEMRRVNSEEKGTFDQLAACADRRAPGRAEKSDRAPRRLHSHARIDEHPARRGAYVHERDDGAPLQARQGSEASASGERGERRRCCRRAQARLGDGAEQHPAAGDGSGRVRAEAHCGRRTLGRKASRGRDINRRRAARVRAADGEPPR